MKAVESEGRSVQEAVDRALLLLGLSVDQVEVSVIREPGENEDTQTAVVRVQPRQSEDREGPAFSEPAPVPEVPSAKATLRGTGEEARGAPGAKTERARGGSAGRRGEGVSGETQERVHAVHRTGGDHEEIPLTDEEGERADRAGDFLEDLFERLSVDCYVEVAADRVEGRIWIDIGGPDTRFIIGRKGTMLDAIELVVNRAMDNADGGGLRIGLDAEGYRERRTQRLRSIAEQQASRAASVGRPVSLDPMNARERRIIHMALRGDRKVRTESEGEGSERHVVIKPIGL